MDSLLNLLGCIESTNVHSSTHRVAQTSSRTIRASTVMMMSAAGYAVA